MRIMQRAGHTNFTTTLIYVRQVEAAGFDLGQPFPPLPASSVAADKGREASSERKSSQKRARNVAPQGDARSCERRRNSRNYGIPGMPSRLTTSA